MNDYLTCMNRHLDHRYLEAMRIGDSKVLEELYSIHVPQVAKWIANNSGGLEDARDVFQEAIIALYNKACDPTFTLTYPIGGLIFQICKNKWIDQLRKNKKEVEVRKVELGRYIDDEQINLLSLDIKEEEVKQIKLDKAFKLLSDKCQRLLQLLLKGKSPKIVANKLEMTDANTVYRRKNACMSRWKKLYQDC